MKLYRVLDALGFSIKKYNTDASAMNSDFWSSYQGTTVLPKLIRTFFYTTKVFNLSIGQIKYTNWNQD